MSCMYSTSPPIEYEKVVKSPIFTFLTPKEPIFTTESTIIVHNGSYIHIRKTEDGMAEFWRFGRNSIDAVFPDLIREFGFEIWDEYGCGPYPNCMS